jgi:diguanylate cyclase (GGDEF)-like protein/PAS domain S-box-containing protein
MLEGDPSHGAEALRLATEAADVGIWFWDLVSDTHQWSERCKAHLALPPGEMPTIERFYSAMHPDDRARVREVIRHSQDTRADYHAEYRIVRPDGSPRWIAGMGRTHDGRDGRPAFMVGVTLDITRLKQVEQELRELNASLEVRVQTRTAEVNAERRRLIATLDGLLDPLVLGRPVRGDAGRITDFTIDYANQAACAWFGTGCEQLQGRRVLECHPAFATTGLLAMLADTVETGRTTAVDSIPFPLDASGVHRIDIRAVRVDERVSFTWRDVTEQHRAAEQMAASEEKFRLLAENSSDVVVRTDAAGRITWVSPSITPVLGWSPTAWIGRAAADVLGLGADREGVQVEYQRALAGHSIVVRARLAARGGSVHWAEIHAGPSRAAGGTIDGVVASFRLVDKEAEAERSLELRARTDELTALLNRKEAIERIEGRTRRTGRTIAVLLCDIDRFKTVNDTYGHAAGDSVLQAVADRIRGCLRSNDDAGARIGGDELLVILHGVHDLEDALAVAEKLRRRAAEPIQTDAGPITVTLSIGVTLACDSESTDALIARADDAMYQAKARGRNQVVGLEAVHAAAGG